MANRWLDDFLSWWSKVNGGAAPSADPTVLTATFVSVNQIDLAWTDNSDNESGFKIERNVDGGDWVLIAAVGAGVEAYSDFAVVEDTVYQYRVRAYRGAKNSGYTNTATAETIPAAPANLAAELQAAPSAPAAPSGLTITFNARNDIDIDWTLNSTDEDGVVVYRSDDGDPSFELVSLAPGVETFKDTSALDDMHLEYKVGAFNGGGTTFSGIEEIDTIPDLPEDLAVSTTSHTELELTWTDRSALETAQEIESREQGGVFALLDTIAADLESYSATGLDPSTTYEFRVRATNAAGNGGYSNTASGTTNAAPTAPSAPDLLVASLVSNTRIDLVWNDTASNETGFRIERADNGGDFVQIAQVATVDLETYSDTTVSEDNEYIYRVRAYNGVGGSGYTNTYTIPTLPAAATSLTATAIGTSSVQLSWTDNSSVEDDYRIQRKVGAGAFADLVTVAADSTIYTDTDLTPETTYTYRVRPTNESGPCATWSNEASDTTGAEEGVTQMPASISGTDYTIPAGEIHEAVGTVVVDNVNIIVEAGGTLRQRPGSFIQFINIDNSTFSFVADGVDVSDKGLWFKPGAIWDAVGTEREPWLFAASALSAGATSISLASVPTGWAVGDEIAIAPTQVSPSLDTTPEFRTLSGVSGSTVSFATGLARAHPTFTDGIDTYRPWVVNLTRDVRVEGTPSTSAYTHVMFSEDGVGGTPQTVKYVGLRYVGVPKTSSTTSGRYAIHVHRRVDAMAGTLFEGVLARDVRSHTFVTHETHGVTWRKCVAVTHFDSAYWWDTTDPSGNPDTDFTETNDLTYDRCASLSMFFINNIVPDVNQSAFTLPRGTNTTITGCISAGNLGDSEGGGYGWPSTANSAPNVWIFEDNLTHNNVGGGSRVWQNSGSHHIVNGFKCFNVNKGISHGAYRTPGYKWFDFVLVGRADITGSGTGIISHSTLAGGLHIDADGYGHRFERGIIKNFQYGVHSTRHVKSAEVPVLIKEVAFSDILTAILFVSEGEGGDEPAWPGRHDFVDCTRDGNALVEADISITTATTKPEYRVRVQNGSSAFQIDGDGTYSVIPTFYPGG